jgi:hypothetical protein
MTKYWKVREENDDDLFIFYEFWQATQVTHNATRRDIRGLGDGWNYAVVQGDRMQRGTTMQLCGELENMNKLVKLSG